MPNSRSSNLRNALLTLQFYAKFSYVGFSMFLWFLSSYLTHRLFVFFGKHGLHQYVTSRFWWFIAARVLGVKVEWENKTGLEGWGGLGWRRHGGKGNCVFVTNHQNDLDTLLISGMYQPYTLVCATWRVRNMPGLGAYLKRSRAVFVDPPEGSGLTNKEILHDTAMRMRKEGLNLWVFPEGIRSYATKPTLLPLKRGAIVVAMEAGHIPLVPVVYGNTSHIFDFGGRRFRNGTVRVRVLNPISTALMDKDIEREDGSVEKETIEEGIDRVLGVLQMRMGEALRDMGPVEAKL